MDGPSQPWESAVPLLLRSPVSFSLLGLAPNWTCIGSLLYWSYQVHPLPLQTLGAQPNPNTAVFSCHQSSGPGSLVLKVSRWVRHMRSFIRHLPSLLGVVLGSLFCLGWVWKCFLLLPLEGIAQQTTVFKNPLISQLLIFLYPFLCEREREEWNLAIFFPQILHSGLKLQFGWCHLIFRVLSQTQGLNGCSI